MAAINSCYWVLVVCLWPKHFHTATVKEQLKKEIPHLVNTIERGTVTFVPQLL
ncbi:hypothetical protein [Niabella hibiscisoli]|uniref:hypothetical protein n=1 Tax=Niabella hibiscisoli TaxID=1825928 RepID=UPI001F0E3C79|nr:hypothetical protein [Niabella hibiscisoli]MCH5718936.1 hypothetical protein [Niabella hibiscisoli]